jgi:hypothetical protein
MKKNYVEESIRNNPQFAQEIKELNDDANNALKQAKEILQQIEDAIAVAKGVKVTPHENF